MSKLLIASDLHGDAVCVEKLLERYRESGAERLVLLGDLLYHGPRNDLPEGYAPKRVIELLNGVKNELDRLIKNSFISEHDGGLVSVDKLELFKNSSLFKEILKSYTKYEVFLVDSDEDGFFDEEKKEKLEDF